MPCRPRCGISKATRRTPVSSGTFMSGGSSRASLAGFLGRRLLQSIPLLLVVSILVFALIHAAPGGPLSIYLSNPNVRPEDIERLRRALGLDRPLWQQYLSWLAAFVRGDWGYSFSDGRPGAGRRFDRLPAPADRARAR